MARRLRILVLHPNLGLGGAERFILDATLALKSQGHDVWLYTTRYDPERSFIETRQIRDRIRVVGAALPDQIGGRLRAPLAASALSYAAFRARVDLGRVDLVLVDLVSAVVPAIRALGLGPVVFYGHYPDLLLSNHESWLSWYRKPLDWLEQRGLAAADRVLVNSRFTLEAFRRTFPDLGLSEDAILYPAVRESLYEAIPELPAAPSRFEVLSFGRFVEHKNHPLVLEAFIKFYERVPVATRTELRLTIAGACDESAAQQRGIKQRLEQRAREAGLSDRVGILTSIDDQQKLDCLRRANVMAFAAFEEHFGLVPLEAMAAARPVIAAERGGPTETIVEGRNGRLVALNADAFADALLDLFANPELAADLGRGGRELVREQFGFASFTRRLDHAARQVAEV